MQSPEALARKNIYKPLTDCGRILQSRNRVTLSATLKDWTSSDKTLSEGAVRRVSAGSANQFQQFVTPDDAASSPSFPTSSTCKARDSTASGASAFQPSDAYLIGLIATPSKQTIGFFNKNLVMEYGHEHVITDNVNVPYDVTRGRQSSAVYSTSTVYPWQSLLE